MSLFSNCGEYLPGQEPPTTSSIPTVTNNVLVVKEERDIIYRIPPDRRPPWQLTWKCERLPPSVCPSGYVGPGFFAAVCLPCDGNPGNPNVGAVGCDFLSSEECRRSPVCAIGGGCTPIPPVYKCDCIELQCPDGQQGVIIDCECNQCDPLGYDNFGNPLYGPGCIYPTRELCEAQCVDSNNCSGTGGGSGGGPGGGTTGGGTIGGARPATTGESTPRSMCVTRGTSSCPPITGSNISVTGAIYKKECLPCRAILNPDGSVRYELPTRYSNNQLINPPLVGDPNILCIAPSTCKTICLDQNTCGITGTEPTEPDPFYACMTVYSEGCGDPLDPECIFVGNITYKECLRCNQAEDGSWVPPTEYYGNSYPNIPQGTTLVPQFSVCVPLSSCQQNCDVEINCDLSCPPALPKWRCKVVEQEYCPEVGTVGPLSRRLKSVRRECEICTPGQNQEGCVYESDSLCRESCSNEEFPCIGVVQNNTNTNNIRYLRQEVQIPCESPLIGTQLYQRTCLEIQCSPADPECIAYSFPDINSCTNGWQSEPGLCTNPNSNTTVLQVQINNNVETNVSVSQFPTEQGFAGNTQGEGGFGDTLSPEQQNPIQRETVISSPTSLLNKLLTGLGIIKNQKVIDTEILASKKQVEVEKVGRSSTALHPAYNFANISNEIPPEVAMVDNDLFRDIFADRVAKEVRYVLIRNIQNLPWDERPIQSITDEKLALSLNPVLLKALNSIHYPDGEKIPLTTLLRSIKRHMLLGNLEDFDVQYFIELEGKQKEDKFNVYLKSPDKTLLEAAALTIIKEKEVTITKDDKDPYNARRLRRQKRLNVDIKTRTCIIKQDGTSCDLSIENAGLLIGKSSGSSIVDAKIGNGAGDGYYLYLNVDGECLPYSYETNEEVTRYPPQNVRYQALKVLGESPDIVIKAKSLSGSHEFTSGTNLTINYQPMFLRLDLESVSSTPQSSYLVDNTSANYLLMTNESEINDYLNSNGFATTRVNLDYRDPILKYIFDTSTLTYSQNDVDFNQMEPKSTSGVVKASTNAVISRTLPFALIVVPVRGSAFNPFNGISDIESIDDRVTRKVTMMPTISQNDTGVFNSPLEEKFLFNETGSFKIGLKETPDSNAITYRFNPSASYLTETFYNKNSLAYSTVPSGVGSLSSYGLSHMVKNSLDYIIDTYGASDVKWFDIYRRLSMTKFVQVMYDSNEELLDQIANSFRDNVQISNIFIEESGNNTTGINYGGSLYSVIEDYGILPEDEKVVISVDDRISILNSPPPIE
jgi:hypothetical protein